MLGIAGTHEEGREGIERRGVVREILLPIGGNETLLHQKIDIRYLVEGDDISFQTLNDGTRLLGGAGVRLINRDTRMQLDESLVLGCENLTGNIVGGVENGGRRLRLRRTCKKSGNGSADNEKTFHEYPRKIEWSST